MNAFHRTSVFDEWLTLLKDKTAKALILKRIRSAEAGNLGDCQPVGQGVSEMRVHYEPGYRAYFTRTGGVVYLLLCGGDKSSQQSDIAEAIEIAKLLKQRKPK
ncbi:MAG: type II toxin-antitoxin system RelE/ParE family toxin [Polaromonas sp.]